MINVCFDTRDQDELTGELMLHAVQLADDEPYGVPIPVVTAAEFARFIAAWAVNDPNGMWEREGVTEGDGALIYRDEFGVSSWRVCGVVDGAPVYALTGWTWALT